MLLLSCPKHPRLSTSEIYDLKQQHHIHPLLTVVLRELLCILQNLLNDVSTARVLALLDLRFRLVPILLDGPIAKR